MGPLALQAEAEQQLANTVSMIWRKWATWRRAALGQGCLAPRYAGGAHRTSTPQASRQATWRSTPAKPLSST